MLLFGLVFSLVHPATACYFDMITINMSHVMPRQDNLKEEEKLKKELRLRMAYAGFLQETVTAMAVKKKTRYAAFRVM